ncbi:MAG: PD-(D/E)XK nuclease family protein, partial [Alphaproteobacteria bacterium]|nr:PD-(D/E)XK nuclease family protein [Alphaproteobacteria bacterium]
ELDIHGFTLVGKADRMDRDATGGLVVVDYKTGAPPTTPQVETGLAPQLALEAAMAKRGAFPGVAAGAPLAGLLYVQLSGGRTPGQEKPVKLDAEEAASNAYEGLAKLIHKFADEKTPYLSRPRPMFESRFGDYDHLARVQEWSAGGEDGE